MNRMIKPKFGEAVVFEDGEIITVIVKQGNNEIPYKIDWLLSGRPKHTTIECLNDTAHRYITNVRKNGKILIIELGESSLNHRR